VLNSYGWSDALQQQFQAYAARGLAPARVVVQQRSLYVLATPAGEAIAQLSGRFAHEAVAGHFPVAGDWVAAALRPVEASATIHHLLPRRTTFTRKAVGHGGAQVVAANVDVAFLVASLNQDLSARRIERYLAMAWESGASPVVVLTKADLCADPGTFEAEIESVALGVPVHVVSALTGEGLDGLNEFFAVGQTAALPGSSGVGKSSLLNALAGRAVMTTQAIREHDARGRRTTTHRELILLPSGRLVLDTPGMRELGVWEAETGLATTFADVETLFALCRFRDCAHETEPGCAVQSALADGRLDAARAGAVMPSSAASSRVSRARTTRARGQSSAECGAGGPGCSARAGTLVSRRTDAPGPTCGAPTGEQPGASASEAHLMHSRRRARYRYARALLVAHFPV
jgi:ribosome biogenesis GTPase / thiamine phosphate phosphatase